MSDAALTDDDDDELRPLRAPAGEIMRYLWVRWTSQTPLLITFLLLYTIAVACDLALPIVSAQLIDALSQGPDAGRSAAVAAYTLFCAIAFGFYFMRNWSVRYWIPLAARNMRDIVNGGFADVQRFSADWHANNFAGATVRRVSRAMNAYDIISDTLVWFVLPAIIVLTGVTVMTAMRWPLIGLFVFVTIVAMLVFNYWAARYYLREDYAQTNAADTRIGASLADAVGANASVKAFGAEAREAERLNAVVEDWRWKAERLWTRGTNTWILQNILLYVLQVGLLGLVLREWAQGRATAGDAAFAITSYFLVSGYLRSIGESIRNLQRGFADISDVVAYANQTADLADPPNARAFAAGAGRIQFDAVSFGYRGQPAPLYRDFSLDIAPGETVALVGPTGSGKSTFVKLVQRLYDVNAGVIRIDGQDVRTVSQASLRRAIAIVPQDPALFHRTLRENIAYARPDAPMEAVIDSARRARAHDFILRLPKGYDTEVGERGVKLSGGERQRVALARAFLADAPILVLDEATSSLDVETERDIQAAMAELMAGRTTIVVAHRLSTIREADRILVFDQGRIVEQGRHRELVESGGLYARLHALAQGDKLAAA
ncbi:MAG: ATP-binding cassette domain-containing protein [Alphaproteobacteria bacterium]|nr:ATP-binding cassette domain-containing protein [Alphaproteobacteria bacterium]